jgi:hypothetical protein
MENRIRFMNAVLFCVFYNLASFTYSVEEKSQTTLELL